MVAGCQACLLLYQYSVLAGPKNLVTPLQLETFYFSLSLLLYKVDQGDIIDVVVSGYNFKAMQNIDSLLVGTGRRSSPLLLLCLHSSLNRTKAILLELMLILKMHLFPLVIDNKAGTEYKNPKCVLQYLWSYGPNSNRIPSLTMFTGHNSRLVCFRLSSFCL